MSEHSIANSVADIGVFQHESSKLVLFDCMTLEMMGLIEFLEQPQIWNLSAEGRAYLLRSRAEA